ncbi:MAG: hypothetical protein HY321_01025 [Armatimonadetes bacterium]|nr:hypothetical protein [Armatimonadota bacterium]
MKSIVTIVAVLAVLGAAIYFVAAPSSGGAQHGQGVSESAPVVAIRDLTANPQAYEGKEVVVKGKMAEQCPTTGCWGVINDGTGAVRFDSAASGWALPTGQMGKQMTVRGIVSVNETGTPEIAAVGARL